MQITNTSAALRPRSVWEAMDLGFVLAQAWWWRLFLLWLGVAIPVFAFSVLISYDNPTASLFILWWLKPAYEQLPLIYLSRALFKQDPAIKIYSWPSLKIIFRQLFLNISIRRLSPYRSFTAPVAQLEHLSGNTRARRLDSLTRDSRGFVLFTLLMLLFEIILALGLNLLMKFLIPENLELVDWYYSHKNIFAHLTNILSFLAAGVIAPFFVAGGFAMYINRRTILEGWDIEIDFKRLQERVQQSAKNVAAWWLPLLLLPTLVLAVSVSSPALADTHEITQESIISKESAKNTINEIMQDKDFGHKETIKRWKYVGKWNWTRDDDNLEYHDVGFLENLSLLIAQIGEFILWGAIGVAIVILLYYLPGWLDRIPRADKFKQKNKQKPNVLFGLNVEKNSLPDDIAAAALALMKAGEYRQCLSLLYRASLSLLIHSHGLEVHDSHTENECLALVESLGKSELASYFATLTRAWVTLAYGHASPSEATLQTLCQTWTQTFEADKT